MKKYRAVDVFHLYFDILPIHTVLWSSLPYDPRWQNAPLLRPSLVTRAIAENSALHWWLTPELSKSESSQSKRHFLICFLSSSSFIGQFNSWGGSLKNRREREHFCAESASILDRFVRLTDFERLTMVDKERICCSKLKGNETKRSYQKFGIPVMITMCNPINYGFLCNFSKTLLLPTTLAKKSISTHINTRCPNKFYLHSYWMLLLKFGESATHCTGCVDTTCRSWRGTPSTKL